MLPRQSTVLASLPVLLARVFDLCVVMCVEVGELSRVPFLPQLLLGVVSERISKLPCVAVLNMLRLVSMG